LLVLGALSVLGVSVLGALLVLGALVALLELGGVATPLLSV
jgi:hypothetical protein